SSTASARGSGNRACCRRRPRPSGGWMRSATGSWMPTAGHHPRIEPFARPARVLHRAPLRRGTNRKAGSRMSESSQGLLKVTRILGGIVLLAIAGIYLFLVFDGVGGVLGVLFNL